MKYVGYFKDINDKSYRVEVISQRDDSQSQEIQLAEEPFVTTWSGNDENIYEPLRASESTLRIVSSTPLLDIYSAEAMGTPVTLYDNTTNEILWKGFVEPQLFDQEWESGNDIIELNCLDYIAIMQYIEYGSVYNDKHVTSFLDIFLKIFSIQGSKGTTFLKHMYIPNSLQIKFTEKPYQLTTFMISPHNFFDEDGESMKCDEVLEHICRFLNYSIIQYKADIYLLDWDSIKADNYECWKVMFPSGGHWQNDVQILSDIRQITKSSYMDSGATISLTPTYNKIVVKDDLYPVEDVFPNFKDNNINWGGTGHVEIVNTPYNPGAISGFDHHSYFQFFKNVYCTSYYYFMDGDLDNQGSLTPRWNSPIANPYTVNYATLRRYVGATLLSHKCEDFDPNKKDPSSLSLENMLLLHCHDKFTTEDTPLFKVHYEDVEFYSGEKTYLVIKGDAIFMDDVDDKNNKGISEMVLVNGHEREDDDFHIERLFIEVVLKVNNQYWDGTKWNNNYSTFKMPFERDDNDRHHFIGKDTSIKNNITWRDHIETEGHKILMPAGKLNSNVEITFLAPKQRIDNSYRLEAIWLKNFGVEFHVSDVNNTTLATDTEKDTDTEYSNAVNKDYVKEMDDITFKVCTKDGKGANYSAVYFENNFVDHVSHTATGKSMRMEEHLIDKLVNQYSTPNTILDLNLINDFKPYSLLHTIHFPGKLFIIDSSTINWEMNTASLHLIEKK